MSYSFLHFKCGHFDVCDEITEKLFLNDVCAKEDVNAIEMIDILHHPLSSTIKKEDSSRQTPYPSQVCIYIFYDDSEE